MAGSIPCSRGMRASSPCGVSTAVGSKLRSLRGQPINAALKHWCHRLGLAAGSVRRPLRALAANQQAALDADLNAAFAVTLRGPPG